jgi:monofunctional biosynthetic peptidoglycan transglycosylase
VVRGLLRWVFRLLVAAAILFGLLLLLWRFAPPVSTLMLGRYASGEPVDRRFVPLAEISPYLRAAVIASEDGQFCRHHGVDWGALREVLNDEDGPSRGASTITMQVAKNLFLWPSRSAVRKGVEIPMAMIVDFAWSKPQVLQTYLNIAEWGDGIFGAEAAARRYFNKPASALTPPEAALLAAALPNPKIRNTGRPSALQRRLALRVQHRMARLGPYLDCVKRTG